MNEMTETDNKTVVRSVERALKILKIFTPERSEISLGEISGELLLPKSTIFRLLRALEAQGFIEQDQQNGYYMLGSEVMRIGCAAQAGKSITAIAKPFMELLSRETGQTSNLYIRQDFDRICIMQVEGNNYVLRYSYIGARMPLYAGASGQVLLAFSDNDFLEKYHANVKLERLTSNTITDWNQLNELLEQIRQRGCAYSLSQRDSLSASVAAPVYDLSKKVVAAVTISGPCAYYTKRFIESSIPHLMNTADRISKKLGY